MSGLLGHLGAASATEPMRQGPVRPPVISARHAPVGTPHQASSFAPRAKSHRRIYGAPIQPAILSRVKPKQPPTPR
jgi:hypothetical protein